MSFPSVYEHIPWLGWRISHRLKRTVRRWQILQSQLLRPDCIYLERGCLNDETLDLDRSLRKTTKRLVLDVDDGIFLKHPKKINSLLAMADHVVVSTETIEEYIDQRHDNITLIPTCIPTDKFKPRADRKTTSKPVIGWMGTAPNMPFLSVCAAALRKLASKHDFELLIIGPTPEPLKQIDLQGVNVRFEPWNAATEVQQLQQIDIGLMPLPDGQDWMKFKAATKLVQYMSIGIPAVASPIGVNATILHGNHIGFAATNDKEWTEALDTLLRDEDLCNQMGKAGRSKALNRYSIEANWQQLERVLCGTTDKVPT